MTTSWHVIWTAYGREGRAAAEISGLGFEVKLPIYRKRRHHNHRIEVVNRPLFPRYLFARFDASVNGWQQIKSDCQSVYAILSDMHNRPYPIQDEIMAAIQSHTDDPTDEVKPDPVYQKGQKVRVSYGPLQGLEGLFVADANKRTMCLLEIIGKQVKVPKQMIEAA